MNYLILLVVVSLPFVANSILLPPVRGLAQRTNSLLSKDLFATSNLSIALGCNGDRFGWDLDLRSCLEAFDYIPTEITRELSFGERVDCRNYDIELPRRYLSCECFYKQRSTLKLLKSSSADGTCAIEPALRRPRM